MVSTAGDLVRWAEELRRGELLSPAMHTEAFTYYPPKEPGIPQEEYLQGVLKIKDYFNEQAVIGHGGGTLGFTAKMYWLEKTGIVIVLLTNVGEMHSDLSPSPVGRFYRQVLLPAVVKFSNR